MVAAIEEIKYFPQIKSDAHVRYKKRERAREKEKSNHVFIGTMARVNDVCRD